MSYQNTFDATTLALMRTTAEASMQDTCEIKRRQTGATDDYGYPAETWETVLTSHCGVKEARQQEGMGSTEVIMHDATLRLPIDLDGLFDQTDRVQVTHRYGEALGSLAITYDIISKPERGVSALVLKMKKVTDGSDV